MNHTLSFTRLGNLDCLATPQLKDRPTIVMLHGYGADFQDLAGLGPALDPTAKFNWIFPNGPLEVPIGPHVMGRAWFPIDMEKLQLQLMRGEIRTYADHLPDGLEAARIKLSELITQLDCPQENLILGGFSQGAMVTCHTCLALNGNVRALLQLSATLVSAEEWRSKLQAHKGMSIFQSHGEMDPILPFAAAKGLRQLFEESAADITFVGFRGGHEIPPVVMEKLRQFLSQKGSISQP